MRERIRLLITSYVSNVILISHPVSRWTSKPRRWAPARALRRRRVSPEPTWTPTCPTTSMAMPTEPRATPSELQTTPHNPRSHPLTTTATPTQAGPRLLNPGPRRPTLGHAYSTLGHAYQLPGLRPLNFIRTLADNTRWIHRVHAYWE